MEQTTDLKRELIEQKQLILNGTPYESYITITMIERNTETEEGEINFRLLIDIRGYVASRIVEVKRSNNFFEKAIDLYYAFHYDKSLDMDIYDYILLFVDVKEFMNLFETVQDEKGDNF